MAQEIQELQQKMLDMEKAMEIQAASMDIVTKQACPALAERCSCVDTFPCATPRRAWHCMPFTLIDRVFSF